jgi:16S rRNA (cytosine967-C5)-methyltransferase
MLHVCGYRLPRKWSRRYWLSLIGAYEASLRKDVVPLQRVAEKTKLSSPTLSCLRRLSPEEAVGNIRDSLRRLAILYSVPRWVVEEFIKLNPPGGVERLLASFQAPTPIWLRVNKRRIPIEKALRLLEENGVKAKPDPILDDLVEVVNVREGALEQLPRSLFYPEDRTPAAAVHMLNRALGDGVVEVVDFFSAPGNKVAHLAWLRGVLLFYAVEASPQRLRTERRLHVSEGVDAFGVYTSSLAEYPPLGVERAGAAIVDPDCTSLGRLGHSPETRVFLEIAGRSLLRRVVEVQEKGLRSAVRVVRRGGLILYTTCTLTSSENEGVVGRLVEEGLVEPIESDIGLGVEGGMRGSRRFYPHLVRATGGFAAVLRRV